MPAEGIEFEISGIGSMNFTCHFDGFGVPCDLCGAENACNRLSGDLPPCVPPGYYCDPCHKIVSGKASDYYHQKLKECTKNLKSTVLFRAGGTWSAKEVADLTNLVGPESGVWCMPSEHPEYLILEGHFSNRSISRTLRGSLPYTVTRVIGNDEKDLPFLPV